MNILIRMSKLVEILAYFSHENFNMPGFHQETPRGPGNVKGSLLEGDDVTNPKLNPRSCVRSQGWLKKHQGVNIVSEVLWKMWIELAQIYSVCLLKPPLFSRYPRSQPALPSPSQPGPDPDRAEASVQKFTSRHDSYGMLISVVVIFYRFL